MTVYLGEIEAYEGDRAPVAVYFLQSDTERRREDEQRKLSSIDRATVTPMEVL